MKILMLSSSDGRGGAFAAAYRLQVGLNQAGVKSKMLVKDKTRSDPNVVRNKDIIFNRWRRLRGRIDRLPLKFYPRRQKHNLFTPAIVPEGIAHEELINTADIVHLHWVGGGFLRIETLKALNKPLVWTLHDLWAFTGGCHYPSECKRYMETCGNCPALGSSSKYDLSRFILLRKRKSWKHLNIVFVSPSNWLAKCAKQNSIFKNMRIEVIPNGLDLECYKPVDKMRARKKFSLPREKKLIMFGASSATTDKRKGFHYLVDALRILTPNIAGSDVEIVIFGSTSDVGQLDVGLKVNIIGKIEDDENMASLYSAADVFVAPSIYDNLPNTVMEAMACGVPCVAFDIGGMPDMIEHGKTGYLVKPYKEDDLADGISWILDDENRWFELSSNCRAKVVNEYEISKISERYAKLYGELLS